jgi:hypothetical protein
MVHPSRLLNRSCGDTTARRHADTGELFASNTTAVGTGRSPKAGELERRGVTTVMNYLMTDPCSECPFLIGSGFTWDSLNAHASGEFACHKTCTVEEDEENYGSFFTARKNSPHCAGALIFLEKQNRPHQMMRICERLGFYDMRKLNMKARVVSKRSDCRALKHG